MIFVTVGHYLPFNRMTKAIDKWAALRDCTDIFAQIGPTMWHPRHIRWANFLKPEEFDKKMKEATVVVAHAGTGTIFETLELGKPILVMPRLVQFHEATTDHQLYMAKRFQDSGLIDMAIDENDLISRLDHVYELHSHTPISASASSQLLNAVHDFVNLYDS